MLDILLFYDKVPLMSTYEIPAANLPGLMFKVGKLSKKSQKLLGKPIDLHMIGEARKFRTKNGKRVFNHEGKPIFDVFYTVSIDAEVPRIAGWTFVATIDHSADAGNLIRIVPNTVESVPEKYRTVKPVCDHCNKIRSRRDTFLLRCDATDEFKQIGRQCVRDFIGYDVENVVAMAELVSHSVPGDSDGDDEGWHGGMGDRRYINVTTFLAHVSACMRAYGWTSRKEVETTGKMATAEAAHMNMFPPKSGKFERAELTEQDFATADVVQAWGKALTPKPGNDYQYNLMVLAKETMIEHRSIGMLASMVSAFMRDKDMEIKRAERNAALNLATSKHVGTIGERLRNMEGIIFGYRTFENTYTGGASYLYKFLVDGNVLAWFSSVPVEGLGTAAAASRVKVRILAGTVKCHKDYQGVKETAIARAKVELAT